MCFLTVNALRCRACAQARLDYGMLVMVSCHVGCRDAKSQEEICLVQVRGIASSMGLMVHGKADLAAMINNVLSALRTQ